ncbi:MAG: tRNA (guanosine(46)-N7)-methyltransferase TrmB [Gammaproteobacteria bacterium]|jgi:tRNA (guanine-N7-)-methyltransferase
MACNNRNTRTMEATRRAIKSYVLRQGRLTRGQQQALDRLWPVYGIDFKPLPIDLAGIFRHAAPVILEIGFGNGDSLLQQARDNPDHNYLGIEVHRPGIGRLLHLAREADISNLRVVNHDAVEVLQLQIPDNSLDSIQLFFPDPWHKKRHHKRRIVNADFIRLVHQKLKPGGTFHLATDWEDYAQYMLDGMEHAQGFVNTAGKGKYAEGTRRPTTKFEHRGRRLGHGVWDLIYNKC